jgi:cytochrome c
MTLKSILAVSGAVAALAFVAPAFGAGDPARGAQVFGACAACHSLEAGEHLTGPSLAKIVGRRAGAVDGFLRYSEALRKSDISWNEATLDAWLADPKKLIPNNFMTFSGLRDAGQRADLIAFLKTRGEATPRGGMGGMMAAPQLESLRDVNPEGRVTAIRYCKDTYFVTLGTGKTFPFWEVNLRFKTNGSAEGPPPGAPVILRAGMRGDRASIVFANPAEISKFIKAKCE